MNIKKEELLEKYWDRLLPVDIEKLVSSCGICILDLDKTKYNEYIGISFIKDGDKYILIDRALHPIRQRFSIAHQLAHHLLDHTKNNCCYDVIENFSSSIKIDQEREANNLAIEILLPEKALKFYMRQKGATLISLSNVFNVSIELLNYRINKMYGF